MTIEYIVNWAEATVPFETCKECSYGAYASDPYGTGDSPEIVECLAEKVEQCPYMEQFAIDVSKLTNIKVADIILSDHPDYCDAFIESADYLGEPLNEDKVEWLNTNHPEIVNELIISGEI